MSQELVELMRMYSMGAQAMCARSPRLGETVFGVTDHSARTLSTTDPIDLIRLCGDLTEDQVRFRLHLPSSGLEALINDAGAAPEQALAQVAYAALPASVFAKA